MLNDEWLNETGAWCSKNVAEINEMGARTHDKKGAKHLKKRVKLYIDQLRHKKSEIELHIKEVKHEYSKESPSEGWFSSRTQQDINSERDQLISIWKEVLLGLEAQILEMKRILLSIDQQVMEQTEGMEDDESDDWDDE